MGGSAVSGFGLGWVVGSFYSYFFWGKNGVLAPLLEVDESEDLRFSGIWMFGSLNFFFRWGVSKHEGRSMAIFRFLDGFVLFTWLFILEN